VEVELHEKWDDAIVNGQLLSDFAAANEQPTSADGWATLQFQALAGYPVSQKQQLLVMFVRARKAGENLLGGISTDRAVRRLGLRPGRITIGGGALAFAGVFTIIGAFVASPVAAAVLIALGGASSNFLLGAAWGTCVDIGGRRSGAVSAAMNTSGQVGAILSPILVATVVRNFSNWSAPIYLTGVLFLLGALCWLWVDPTKPVSE
jgi:MFS family permease